MQNKFLYQILCSGLIVLGAHVAMAQENVDFLDLDPAPKTATQKSAAKNAASEKPKAAVTPNLDGRKPVDFFPARTSLNTLETATLPGINDTDITGPAPFATSVSTKDMPSERLLGLLTPEVFKEMANLERDNTFLKLQIQKEGMKNDLEKLRANYRQARLDEISKREALIRTRIQWWQEQEKIRQDLEAQRAAAEASKADEDESALLDIPTEDEEGELEKVAEETKPAEPVAPVYALVGISGTRGLLTAQIKNTETGRVSNIQKGDTLTDGSTVGEITPSQVILIKNGNQKALTFEDV